MLHLKKVLGAKPKEHVEAQLETMFTPWGESLDVDHILEEHPTPQFARASYSTLNGVWDCAFVPGTHEPSDDLLAVTTQARIPDDAAFDQTIVVPFSPEAPLSGVKKPVEAVAVDAGQAERTPNAPETTAQNSDTAQTEDAATQQDADAAQPESSAPPQLGRQLQPTELLWYRRSFAAPARPQGHRVLLHFQAVDYACAVRVNGKLVGSHAGGYTPFAFDITDTLDDGENELLVCVADPSEFGGQLRGKQRFDRGDIWYTAQSGIWQTVWIETVAPTHIAWAKIEPDAQTGIVAVGAIIAQREEANQSQEVSITDTGATSPAAEPEKASDEQTSAKTSRRAHGITPGAPSFIVEILADDGSVIASDSCAIEAGIAAAAVHVPDAHLWSPEDPYLYRLRLTCGDDVVESYCAFRTIEMKRTDDGHSRVFLNGEPLFIEGVLDQGYWSDGLMTAPSDEALVTDIQAMRDAGFNVMRKHIKIESERWYYHCDRLGMLVIQDMINGGAADINLWHWSYKPTLFKFSWNHFGDNMPSYWKRLGSADPKYQAEWTATCREAIWLLSNHPCIIGWSLFNEGWGQFHAKRACELARSLDSTRFIDAVSGWYDQRCGDFSSVHNYFRDLKVWPDKRLGRAFIISEFGGFTHRVDGHAALDEAYGYEPYDDVAEWRRAVRALLAEARSLEPDGLVGYIYTQVSDIEEETNGILTYDRRVNKLDES